MYILEKYKKHNRYNDQYDEVYNYLLTCCDKGYNEHFHWARFEWMIGHPMLEADQLDHIVLFRNQEGVLEGMLTFDTFYGDRYYIIHNNNECLVREMVDFISGQDGESAIVKVNSKDALLINILQEKQFVQKQIEEHVLQIPLNRQYTYYISGDYQVSSEDFALDKYKYQTVIHKGFDHQGMPDKNEEQYVISSPHSNNSLKIFAFDDQEYCAHCGIWYTEGETAYIEPVVTIPRCRKQGLGRAVVYEALNRAGKLGAKRAIVLSGQEFYYSLGFQDSSEFALWGK